jgi:hypothetical protein
LLDEGVLVSPELLNEPEKLEELYKEKITEVSLLPPIEIIKNEFSAKKLVIAFPPRRDSYHLRKIADVSFRLGRGKFSNCQLPHSVQKPDGHILVRPQSWR